jgi:putative ABC transport system permease protein
LDGGPSSTARLSIGQEGIGELGDPVAWERNGLGLLIDPTAVADVDRLGVTALYVATDGTPAAEDRVRTAILAARPGSSLAVTGDTVDAQRQFAELGWIIAMGLVGTMAFAGASLAIAVTVAVLDRRRQFVSLRMAGMSGAVLRRMVLLQAGAPLVLVTIASALLAVAVTTAILAIASIDLAAMPVIEVAGVVVVSIATAIVVVLAVLPPLERLTRPDSLRTE